MEQRVGKQSLVADHMAIVGDNYVHLHITCRMIMPHIVSKSQCQLMKIECTELYRSSIVLKTHHGVQIIYQFRQPIGIIKSAGYKNLFLLLGDILISEDGVKISLYDGDWRVQLMADIDTNLTFMKYFLMLSVYLLPIEQEKSL